MVLLTAGPDDEGKFLAALHETLEREPRQRESELVTHGEKLFQLMMTKSVRDWTSLGMVP
jgi:hypothetical protein